MSKTKYSVGLLAPMIVAGCAIKRDIGNYVSNQPRETIEELSHYELMPQAREVIREHIVNKKENLPSIDCLLSLLRKADTNEDKIITLEEALEVIKN